MMSYIAVLLAAQTVYAVQWWSPITDMDSGNPFLGDKFMEMGTAYVTSGIWTTIYTEYDSFANGKVFASIVQRDSAEIFDFPMVARIKNVRSTGQACFDISLFYPSRDKCQDYITPSINDTYSAVISWMVVEAGGYTLDDGKVQLVIGTELVSSLPTRVFWSHRFGTTCSLVGGLEDVSEPGGIFTIQSVNHPYEDMYMVPRVHGWERVGSQCDFSWKQSYMWVEGHSYQSRSAEIHEEVNYLLFSSRPNGGYAVRCINDQYTLNFATGIGVSSVMSNVVRYSTPSYFAQKLSEIQTPDEFFLPRVFAAVTTYREIDTFAVYAVQSSVLKSMFFLQEDACQDHSIDHEEESMSYILIGRDMDSVDAFGNTVNCKSDDAYSVKYYEGDLDDDSKSGRAAIIAAFFVSFSIVLCFTCGIAGPRLYAYLNDESYIKSDGEGRWGVPGGRVIIDVPEDDGSIDRSSTPFTHTTDQRVASDNGSNRA